MPRKWLTNLRKSKGLKQIELCSLLGVTQGYLSGIEQGYKLKKLDLEMMVKLSTIFGISLEDISKLEKGDSCACQH